MGITVELPSGRRQGKGRKAKRKSPQRKQRQKTKTKEGNGNEKVTILKWWYYPGSQAYNCWFCCHTQICGSCFLRNTSLTCTGNVTYIFITSAAGVCSVLHYWYSMLAILAKLTGCFHPSMNMDISKARYGYDNY